MTLSPVRRLGVRGRLRGLFRPGPLAWFAGLVVTATVVESLPFPGAGIAGKVLLALTVGIPLRMAMRRDRELHALELLQLRAPRRADPTTAPAPSLRAVALRTRTMRWMVGFALTGAAAILVATPMLVRSATEDPQDFEMYGLPPGAWWVLGPLGALVLVVAAAVDARSALRGRPVALEGLPRRMVTVLGFTGDQGREVVLVPGEVTVPQDPWTGTYDVVVAGVVAYRALPDLVPGDVLVCDGRLEPGAQVALSDGTVSTWTTRLRAVPEEELKPRQTFREMWREADAEARQEVAEQRAREERLERGLGQRQTAFERDAERRRAALEARLADGEGRRP